MSTTDMTAKCSAEWTSAKRPECAVPGCERPALTKRLCNAHYLRSRRHGSPTGGGPSPGDARGFVLEAVEWSSDECLIWPHGRGNDGYGVVSFDGKSVGAHARVLSIAHGDKPSAKHEACHKCGNRLCVNPRHLYWGRRSDNIADAIRHGTWSPPPISGSPPIYSDDDLTKLESLVLGGLSWRAAAKVMGIPAGSLGKLRRRVSGLRYAA